MTITFIFPDFRAVQFILFGLAPLIEAGLASLLPIAVDGYEMYLVEQWLLERNIGTILTTFTGNTAHTLQATKVEITSDSSLWPPRFVKYLAELRTVQHAKLKEFGTEGLLFVTNLASFQLEENLNILFMDPVYPESTDHIPVPLNYARFEANFNLKRLGCAGRSALLFSDPPKASADKFYSIYKVHEQVPIIYGVKAMVMLVQIALYYFDLLNPMYCDGILCRRTQLAAQKWWNLFGSSVLGPPPEDGALGPKTVAAILSVLVSCRLRLNLVTSDNCKDPFDILAFKKAIYQFQKSIKGAREKSWLLDTVTFARLMEASDEKLAYDNLLKLKKAVNKTVNDISRKNRISNISIETTNIDELKLNLHGKRLEYLFLNRGRKPRLNNEILELYSQRQRTRDGIELRTEPPKNASRNTVKTSSSEHVTQGLLTSQDIAGSPANVLPLIESTDGLMSALKNAATLHKQRLNDGLSHMSKAVSGLRFHARAGSLGALKSATKVNSPVREKYGTAPRTDAQKDPVDDHHLSSNPLKTIRNLHSKSRLVQLQLLSREDEEALLSGQEALSMPKTPPSADRLQVPFETQETPFLGFQLPEIAIEDVDDYKGLDEFYSYLNASLAGLADVRLSQELEGDFMGAVAKRLARRMSVPGTVLDLNELCLELDMEAVDDLVKRPLVVRRHSFSLIEENVLHWTCPFEVPVEAFCREYLRGKLEELKAQPEHMNENAELQKSSSATSLQSLSSIGVRFNPEEEVSTAAFQDFSLLLQQCQTLVAKKLDTLTKTVINTLRFKEIYENKCQEIETLISKLCYEVRILRIRVGDVDHSVSEFKGKIKRLKDGENAF